MDTFNSGEAVVIYQDAPFTVPAGKIFHLTGLSSEKYAQTGLLVNAPRVGIDDGKGGLDRPISTLLFWRDATGDDEKNTREGSTYVPMGWSAVAGEIVTVTNDAVPLAGAPRGIALGVLTPAP